ncbi:MAG: hypothetical protein M3327_06180 [Actinomycetota bacterium]|nr:hypothetical protein [Actinomycetota bacterium]
MSRGDQLVERGAERLQELSREMAARGGLAEKLAGELAEDAVFLRKLKPSLIAARARGEAPTDQRPETDVRAPIGPQIPKRPKPPGAGPNPLVVIGAALAVGIVLAKILDWRGHAHPRR